MKRVSVEMLDFRIEATEVTVIDDPYRANYSVFALLRLVSKFKDPLSAVDCEMRVFTGQKTVAARMSRVSFAKWRIFWESSETRDFGFVVKQPHYDALQPLFSGEVTAPLTCGIPCTGWIRFDFFDIAEREITEAESITITVIDAFQKRHSVALKKPWPKGNGVLAEPSWLTD